jgi:hypothetical protein
LEEKCRPALEQELETIAAIVNALNAQQGFPPVGLGILFGGHITSSAAHDPNNARIFLSTDLLADISRPYDLSDSLEHERTHHKRHSAALARSLKLAGVDFTSEKPLNEIEVMVAQSAHQNMAQVTPSEEVLQNVKLARNKRPLTPDEELFGDEVTDGYVLRLPVQATLKETENGLRILNEAAKIAKVLGTQDALTFLKAHQGYAQKLEQFDGSNLEDLIQTWKQEVDEAHLNAYGEYLSLSEETPAWDRGLQTGIEIKHRLAAEETESSESTSTQDDASIQTVDEAKARLSALIQTAHSIERTLELGRFAMVVQDVGLAKEAVAALAQNIDSTSINILSELANSDTHAAMPAMDSALALSSRHMLADTEPSPSELELARISRRRFQNGEILQLVRLGKVDIKDVLTHLAWAPQEAADALMIGLEKNSEQKTKLCEILIDLDQTGVQQDEWLVHGITEESRLEALNYLETFEASNDQSIMPQIEGLREAVHNLLPVLRQLNEAGIEFMGEDLLRIERKIATIDKEALQHLNNQLGPANSIIKNIDLAYETSMRETLQGRTDLLEYYELYLEKVNSLKTERAIVEGLLEEEAKRLEDVFNDQISSRNNCPPIRIRFDPHLKGGEALYRHFTARVIFNTKFEQSDNGNCGSLLHEGLHHIRAMLELRRLIQLQVERGTPEDKLIEAVRYDFNQYHSMSPAQELIDAAFALHKVSPLSTTSTVEKTAKDAKIADRTIESYRDWLASEAVNSEIDLTFVNHALELLETEVGPAQIIEELIYLEDFSTDYFGTEELPAEVRILIDSKQESEASGAYWDRDAAYKILKDKIEARKQVIRSLTSVHYQDYRDSFHEREAWALTKRVIVLAKLDKIIHAQSSDYALSDDSLDQEFIDLHESIQTLQTARDFLQMGRTKQAINQLLSSEDWDERIKPGFETDNEVINIVESINSEPNFEFESPAAEADFVERLDSALWSAQSGLINLQQSAWEELAIRGIQPPQIINYQPALASSEIGEQLAASLQAEINKVRSGESEEDLNEQAQQQQQAGPEEELLGGRRLNQLYKMTPSQLKSVITSDNVSLIPDDQWNKFTPYHIELLLSQENILRALRDDTVLLLARRTNRAGKPLLDNFSSANFMASRLQLRPGIHKLLIEHNLLHALPKAALWSMTVDDVRAISDQEWRNLHYDQVSAIINNRDRAHAIGDTQILILAERFVTLRDGSLQSFFRWGVEHLASKPGFYQLMAENNLLHSLSERDLQSLPSEIVSTFSEAQWLKFDADQINGILQNEANIIALGENGILALTGRQDAYNRPLLSNVYTKRLENLTFSADFYKKLINRNALHQVPSRMLSDITPDLVRTIKANTWSQFNASQISNIFANRDNILAVDDKIILSLAKRKNKDSQNTRSTLKSLSMNASLNLAAKPGFIKMMVENNLIAELNRYALENITPDIVAVISEQQWLSLSDYDIAPIFLNQDNTNAIPANVIVELAKKKGTWNNVLKGLFSEAAQNLGRYPGIHRLLAERNLLHLLPSEAIAEISKEDTELLSDQRWALLDAIQRLAILERFKNNPDCPAFLRTWQLCDAIPRAIAEQIDRLPGLQRLAAIGAHRYAFKETGISNIQPATEMPSLLQRVWNYGSAIATQQGTRLGSVWRGLVALTAYIHSSRITALEESDSMRLRLYEEKFARWQNLLLADREGRNQALLEIWQEFNVPESNAYNDEKAATNKFVKSEFLRSVIGELWSKGTFRDHPEHADTLISALLAINDKANIPVILCELQIDAFVSALSRLTGEIPMQLWQPAAALGLACVFGREWPNWLRAYHKAWKAQHGNEVSENNPAMLEKASHLPIAPQANLQGLDFHLNRNVSTPAKERERILDELELVAENWVNLETTLHDKPEMVNKLQEAKTIENELARIRSEKQAASRKQDTNEVSRLSALEAKLRERKLQKPHKTLMEALAAAAYQDVIDDNFALESKKYLISPEKFKAYQDRFIASRFTPSAFPLAERWYQGDGDERLEAYFIPRTDPRGPYIGRYLQCCMHTEGPARQLAWYCQEHPNGGVFVVVKDGKIVGGSPTVVTDDGGILFHSVETGGSAELRSSIRSLCTKAAETLKTKYKFHTINLGLSEIDQNLVEERTSDVVAFPSDYSDYYNKYPQLQLAHNPELPKSTNLPFPIWIRGMRSSALDNQSMDIEILKTSFANEQVADLIGTNEGGNRGLPTSTVLLQSRQGKIIGYAIVDSGSQRVLETKVLEEHEGAAQMINEAVAEHFPASTIQPAGRTIPTGNGMGPIKGMGPTGFQGEGPADYAGRQLAPPVTGEPLEQQREYQPPQQQGQQQQQTGADKRREAREKARRQEQKRREKQHAQLSEPQSNPEESGTEKVVPPLRDADVISTPEMKTESANPLEMEQTSPVDKTKQIELLRARVAIEETTWINTHFFLTNPSPTIDETARPLYQDIWFAKAAEEGEEADRILRPVAERLVDPALARSIVNLADSIGAVRPLFDQIRALAAEESRQQAVPIVTFNGVLNVGHYMTHGGPRLRALCQSLYNAQQQFELMEARTAQMRQEIETLVAQALNEIHKEKNMPYVPVVIDYLAPEDAPLSYRSGTGDVHISTMLFRQILAADTAAKRAELVNSFVALLGHERQHPVQDASQLALALYVGPAVYEALKPGSGMQIKTPRTRTETLDMVVAALQNWLDNSSEDRPSPQLSTANLSDGARLTTQSEFDGTVLGFEIITGIDLSRQLVRRPGQPPDWASFLNRCNELKTKRQGKDLTRDEIRFALLMAESLRRQSTQDRHYAQELGELEFAKSLMYVQGKSIHSSLVDLVSRADFQQTLSRANTSPIQRFIELKSRLDKTGSPQIIRVNEQNLRDEFRAILNDWFDDYKERQIVDYHDLEHEVMAWDAQIQMELALVHTQDKPWIRSEVLSIKDDQQCKEQAEILRPVIEQLTDKPFARGLVRLGGLAAEMRARSDQVILTIQALLGFKVEIPRDGYGFLATDLSAHPNNDIRNAYNAFAQARAAYNQEAIRQKELVPKVERLLGQVFDQINRSMSLPSSSWFLNCLDSTPLRAAYVYARGSKNLFPLFFKHILSARSPQDMRRQIAAIVIEENEHYVADLAITAYCIHEKTNKLGSREDLTPKEISEICLAYEELTGINLDRQFHIVNDRTAVEKTFAEFIRQVNQARSRGNLRIYSLEDQEFALQMAKSIKHINEYSLEEENLKREHQVIDTIEKEANIKGLAWALQYAQSHSADYQAILADDRFGQLMNAANASRELGPAELTIWRSIIEDWKSRYDQAALKHLSLETQPHEKYAKVWAERVADYVVKSFEEPTYKLPLDQQQLLEAKATAAQTAWINTHYFLSQSSELEQDFWIEKVKEDGVAFANILESAGEELANASFVEEILRLGNAAPNLKRVENVVRKAINSLRPRADLPEVNVVIDCEYKGVNPIFYKPGTNTIKITQLFFKELVEELRTASKASGLIEAQKYCNKMSGAKLGHEAQHALEDAVITLLAIHVHPAVTTTLQKTGNPETAIKALTDAVQLTTSRGAITTANVEDGLPLNTQQLNEVSIAYQLIQDIDLRVQLATHPGGPLDVKPFTDFVNAIKAKRQGKGFSQDEIKFAIKLAAGAKELLKLNKLIHQDVQLLSAMNTRLLDPQQSALSILLYLTAQTTFQQRLSEESGNSPLHKLQQLKESALSANPDESLLRGLLIQNMQEWADQHNPRYEFDRGILYYGAFPEVMARDTEIQIINAARQQPPVTQQQQQPLEQQRKSPPQQQQAQQQQQTGADRRRDAREKGKREKERARKNQLERQTQNTFQQRKANMDTAWINTHFLLTETADEIAQDFWLETLREEGKQIELILRPAAEILVDKSLVEKILDLSATKLKISKLGQNLREK